MVSASNTSARRGVKGRMQLPRAPSRRGLTGDADRAQNRAIEITVARRAPLARHLLRGILQLALALAAAVIVGFTLFGPVGLVTSPDHPERSSALFGLAWAAPAFLLLTAFGVRNLHRLRLPASVSVDTRGVVLRLPVVPFPLSPLLVVREQVVPWPDVDLAFTPGRRSRLLVSRSRPEAIVASRLFDISLYEMEAGLRAAALNTGQEVQYIQSTQVFTGSSPMVLLIAGGACAGVFGGAMFAVPELAAMLSLGLILGLALIGMSLAPRKRVVLDDRGILVERGEQLDFIPREALAQARFELSRSLFGAFQSGYVDTNVGTSRLRVGFNRVFGLGFAVEEVMSALHRG